MYEGDPGEGGKTRVEQVFRAERSSLGYFYRRQHFVTKYTTKSIYRQSVIPFVKVRIFISFLLYFIFKLPKLVYF